MAKVGREGDGTEGEGREGTKDGRQGEKSYTPSFI